MENCRSRQREGDQVVGHAQQGIVERRVVPDQVRNISGSPDQKTRCRRETDRAAAVLFQQRRQQQGVEQAEQEAEAELGVQVLFAGAFRRGIWFGVVGINLCALRRDFIWLCIGGSRHYRGRCGFLLERQRGGFVPRQQVARR